MIDRYSRQIIFRGIGKTGQNRLANSTVAIIGCGALGTVIATILVRAGVGNVRIVDRDFIEYHNLQRQVLFDEDDVINNLPKAIAAERHLRKENSTVHIEGIVADVNFANIEKFIREADIVLDGLDNIEARLLINDACLKHGIPWIYGGAISSFGMTMTIIPGRTACLRCFYTKSRSPELALTCDTAGVIAPAPFIIGSLQATAAIKILVGEEEINTDLISIDVWKCRFQNINLKRRDDCPSCQGKFEFLEGRFGIKTTSLCGQNAVQIINSESRDISLENLANHLKPLGEVSHNEFMLRFLVDKQEMFIFPDGRAIVKNTSDESFARALYAKYIGA